jgi:hypothetical protein
MSILFKKYSFLSLFSLYAINFQPSISKGLNVSPFIAFSYRCALHSALLPLDVHSPTQRNAVHKTLCWCHWLCASAQHRRLPQRQLPTTANHQALREFLWLGVSGVVSMSEWWFWEASAFIAGSLGPVPLAAYSVRCVAVGYCCRLSAAAVVVFCCCCCWWSWSWSWSW